jgi:phosphatidylethanolamine/phosphatidyl-N-methylethanolamine N-methyltransferase
LRYYFLSRFYDLLIKWFYDRKLIRIVEMVNGSPGEQVLEVGAGTGLSLPHYAKNKQVVAIDSSKAMLKLAAKRNGRHTLLHRTAQEVLPSVGDFDHVVFCNVLSVIKHSDQLLLAYYSTLKSSASIYILNHFSPERGPLRLLDKLLRPAGYLLGFKSYFPIRSLLTDEMIKNSSITPLTAGGYWSIIKITKP